MAAGDAAKVLGEESVTVQGIQRSELLMVVVQV